MFRSSFSIGTVAAILILGSATDAHAAIKSVAPSAHRGEVLSFRLPSVSPAAVKAVQLRRAGRRQRVSVSSVRRSLRRSRVAKVRSKVGVRGARLVVRTRSTAPSTTIVSGPSGTTSATTATFRLSSRTKRARLECRLDDGRWRRCGRTYRVRNLDAGTHTFSARARRGAADRSPATREWTVADRVALSRPGAGSGAGSGSHPAQGSRPSGSKPSGVKPVPSSPSPSGTPAPSAPSDAPAPVTGRQLLRDTFDGPDGLITNAYAFWDGDWDERAVQSSIWETETGSFFRRSGSGWSGVPDGRSVNRDSSAGTGSEIFRMWTRRADFGDVAVTTDLLHERWSDGSPGWEAKSWDGVKLWLRRQGHTGADVRFYSVEVNRRQGNVLIQKKCSEDDYTVLASTSTGSHPARTGSWERVGGTARTNADGSVTVQLLRDGRVVLEATDRGELCAPLSAPGRVGIRADNAQFRVDDFTVSAL